MKNIFLDSYAVAQKLPSTALQARTALYLGDTQTPETFIMFEVSGGSQNARLQVDAAADGSLYAIGCKGGIGSYEMAFYDGPFSDCKSVGSGIIDAPDSFVERYMSLQTIPDRRARVYIYRDTTTQVVGKFVGVLNNMATQIVDNAGLLYLRVGVNMLGSWQG